MSLKFTGSFDDLKAILSSLDSDWDTSQPGKKVLRINGGVLNWFESTGTLQFQGKADSKTMLEQHISHLLYPDEYPEPPEISKKIKSLSEVEQRINTPIQEDSIEKKYLEGTYTETELVIGIVNAVGTETRRVVEPLTNRLNNFGYDVKEIKVSSLLDVPSQPKEYERIKLSMEKGDFLRKESNDNAILAAGAIKKIQESRGGSDPSKTVFLINSLKHPDEVALLRRVYSHGFFLLGIHSDEKRRTGYLVNDKGLGQQEAADLIKIDEDEAVTYGQRTRDTYHLSDFFVNLGRNEDQVKNTIQRFLDLLFSYPYSNPTFDEFAMFMAFNSSIRSSDLSRQVGAVITRNQQIIATGTNDSPRFGGGQYWAEVDPETGEVKDFPGGKDYTREQDSNKAEQADIIGKIITSLKEEQLLNDEDEEKFKKTLKESRISDLTEFGRVVHAEMEALLSCAREGIETVGSTLYCTTFPCHNCAKHLINAGVERVVYVEPYPKSKALELHSDSIDLKTQLDTSDSDERVIFEPFTGIGARRFLDLFSMNLGAGSKLKRKDKDGNTLEWDKDSAHLRVQLIAKSYLDIETAAIEKFEKAIADAEEIPWTR